MAIAAKKRVRRPYKEIYLDKIKNLSGPENKYVSNATLKGELNWDEDRYWSIRDQLISEGLIVVGRGQGGTVAPLVPKGAKSLSVFISYSHKDEDIKGELIKHLTPLKRMGLIKTWDDRKILAGAEWDREISENLNSADIVLIVVSIDFINSNYCYDIELEAALARHYEGKCRVVPIIARACLWSQAPFAKLQALPADGKPISSFVDRDAAFVQVAEGIRQTAEDVLGGLDKP